MKRQVGEEVEFYLFDCVHIGKIIDTNEDLQKYTIQTYSGEKRIVPEQDVIDYDFE